MDGPARPFTCSNCGQQIADESKFLYSAFIQIQGPDFTDFTTIMNINVDGDNSKVECNWCGKNLGIKIQNSWRLFNKNIDLVPFERPIKVKLCSLREQELNLFTKFLYELNFPHPSMTLKVFPQMLQKSKLKNFQFSDQADVYILVHKCEGRLLLTDRNGLFHDFLAQAFSQSLGQILIILTKCEEQQNEHLFDQLLIQTISIDGGQPTMQSLSNLNKVITCGELPNKIQRQHIINSILNATFYKQVTQFQSLPSEFHPQQPKKSNGMFICNLL